MFTSVRISPPWRSTEHGDFCSTEAMGDCCSILDRMKRGVSLCLDSFIYDVCTHINKNINDVSYQKLNHKDTTGKFLSLNVLMKDNSKHLLLHCVLYSFCVQNVSNTYNLEVCHTCLTSEI